MRGDWRNLQTAAGESLLDLLHREAEEPLEPSEQALLDAQNDNPDVQAARYALQHAVTLLRGPNPPMPLSVAPDVVADIALATQLAAPVIPSSVARDVTEAVQLAALLQPPAPAHSVAREVLADIQAAQVLQAPRIPQSIAAAVTGDIRAAQSLSQAPTMPQSVAAAVAADIQMSRSLTSPPMPRSVAAAVTADIHAGRTLGQILGEPPALAPVPSVAASVVHRIQTELSPARPAPQEVLPEVLPPVIQSPAIQSPAPTNWQALNVMSGLPVPRTVGGNPAPFMLVGGLLVGLTLLAMTTAWPNLAAGAVVLRTLLTQVSPLAGLGLALLLLTSTIITWRPTPALRTAGAGAFALSAILTIPALYNVAGGGNDLTIGRDVTVNGPVNGNVMALGGNVHLKPGAIVHGEVVTLLGDVHREEGAQVEGRVNALLGHAPGDREAIQTRPVSTLGLATAAAFRPVLGWLGAAAWPQIFVALTGGLLLMLFLAGEAPVLAQRQRHAPMRTLALGVLMLAALIIPGFAFGMVGLLGPALLVAAVAALLIATGLSVSVYDAGRSVAHRFNLPVPDAVGALLGLSAFAASLSYAPLAFALALVGGAWGAGTLFLTRQGLRTPLR